ncbi:unnamed protein product [Ambrosiozyma monospora]|uniref:Unnamed protein product n=1 Tax=Ambrosiozyma monospora TaxID=43982 RepID=A0A9W6YLX7_AMBMO|nr:unnamed protein product [Ambrosiozyma monospora]
MPPKKRTRRGAAKSHKAQQLKAQEDEVAFTAPEEPDIPLPEDDKDDDDYKEEPANEAIDDEVHDDEDEEDDDEAHVDEEDDTGVVKEEEDGDGDGDGAEVDAEAEAEAQAEAETESNKVAKKTESRGRGRPKLKRKKKQHEDARKRRQNNGLDEDGNPIVVKDHEVVTPDDPLGEQKIDKLGNLKGGRMFMVRTFTIPNQGERLYMVSTDAARNVGYRDSYFLFQKHKKLFRVVLPEEDKPGLIASGVLTSTYKTRSVYLVTARSIFKEFGARTIANGKQVIDDYYEAKARANGAIEGAPAIVTEQYPSTSFGISSERNKLASALASAPGGGFVAETTWIYDHALKVRQFEEMLQYDRREVFNAKFVRDVYTGLSFYPSITQPTEHKVLQIKELENPKQKKKLTVETQIGDTSFIKTGLKDVPVEFFDGCVDEETKKAILEQQKLERVFDEEVY